MGADAHVPATGLDVVAFDDFYDRTLPVVFGYLLRLCGGDREQAWDLTQDAWVTVVDRLARGETDKATVGFLISVARSRYLDWWRRQQRPQRKLGLVWAGTRAAEPADVSAAISRDHPVHRHRRLHRQGCGNGRRSVGEAARTTQSTDGRGDPTARRHGRQDHR